MRFRGLIWLLLTAGAVSLGGFHAGGGCCAVADAEDQPKPATEARERAKREKPVEEYYELLELFVDALDQVERNYVKEVSRRELVEAAIRGMLSKLDQHTDYIQPDELERFRSGVESEFGGIGLHVSVKGGKLIVVSPLVGTPAYRAGLVSGDIITHIGEEPTEGITLESAIKRLKGEVGSKIALRVMHPVDGNTETVSLTREIIRVETVLGDRRGKDQSWDFMYDKERGIGYVWISAFGRHTGEDLRRALERLNGQGLKGLVLDLRFNPGGLLSSAVEVADLFVSEGRIVSTSGRNVVGQTWDAHREGTFEGFPVAVLVNHYSASASEIVAACLQDHKRAIVVGQRTFGKGSVQNIVELEQGRSALKLTTASYQRPSGKNIDRPSGAKDSDDWGVRPSDGFEVPLSEAETRQLFRLRHARDTLQPVEAAKTEAGKDRQAPQLDKALAYLREQIAAAKKQVASENVRGQPTSRDR